MSSEQDATVAAGADLNNKEAEEEQKQKQDNTNTNTINNKDKDKDKEDGTSSSSTDVSDDNDNDNDNDNDDSDADSATKEDPEILLIKANQLKEEGNKYFKEKDYEKAARSYRRGTNTLKSLNQGNTGDDQVKVLLLSLQTNLSMMCFKLNKHRQSSQVATAALKIDSTNVKARYRRAVARRKLGESEEAKIDLKEALKQDPTNVAVKKELVSLKKEMDESTKAQKKSLQKAFSKGGGLLYDDKKIDKKKQEEEKQRKKKQEEEAVKKRKVEWEDECVKRMAKGALALSFEEWEKEQEEKGKKQKEEEEKRKREERRTAKTAAKDEQSDSDEELTKSEIAQLRGYKKTSDGRTTSYFNREQSSETKNLIGDITPQRLEPVTADSVTNSEGVKGNASKWNQAGTWEEKDVSEWCRERLITRLKEAKAEARSLICVVADVKDMTGHASVAIVGGKKRYIFDFHCKVNFEIKDPQTDDVLASGSLQLPDICSTHHEELEVQFEGWKKSPSSNHEQLATECRLGVTAEVRESVKLWVNDFNKMY